MEGLVNSISKFVLQWTGLERLIKLWEEGEWWWALGVTIAVTLSMFWMRRLWEGAVASAFGKSLGGLSIGFLKIMLAILITLKCLSVLMGAAIAAILGGVLSIPFIGWIVKHFLMPIVSLVISLVTTYVMIKVGIYIFKNLGSLAERAGGEIKGEMGQDSLKHQLAGTFVLSYFVICHPEINAKLYYVPMIGSSVMGIVAIFRTAAGKSALAAAKGRFLNTPREDGRWRCENEGRDYVESPKGSGKHVRSKKVSRCHGPQGPGQDGWNPKEATHCMSTTCDHPNPYWIACDCGYSKDGESLVRRDPRAHYKCPGCGKTHPPIPRTTSFHPPGEDKVNAGAKAKATPASPSHKAVAAAPTGTAAAPTPPCPHCGEQNRPQAVFCRRCRGKMGERSLADEALDEPFARN